MTGEDERAADATENALSKPPNAHGTNEHGQGGDDPIPLPMQDAPGDEN